MLVVDASIIVKIFVDEPGSVIAADLVRRGTELRVPAHAFAEAMEVVARKMARDLVPPDQVISIVAVLRSNFVVVPLDDLLIPAIQLSIRTGASVYDCLYVALAASLDCRLVTADRRLIAKLAETEHAALMADLNSFTASP